MINDLLRLHLIIMQLVKPKNVKMTMQQKSRSNTIKMCNISDIPGSPPKLLQFGLKKFSAYIEAT